MFPAGFISGSRDFRPHFNFRCFARATFDRDFDFADEYILVMAWMLLLQSKIEFWWLIEHFISL